MDWSKMAKLGTEIAKKAAENYKQKPLEDKLNDVQKVLSKTGDIADKIEQRKKEKEEERKKKSDILKEAIKHAKTIDVGIFRTDDNVSD